MAVSIQAAELAVLGAYYVVLGALAAYGAHRCYLLHLYAKHRFRKAQAASRINLPTVTVQLPIYNEMYVVGRLISTVSNLDYPRPLLEIQVIDDSTDETSEIAQVAIAHYRSLGVDIKYLHRGSRHGYKAGALSAALYQARGRFIAIFDADFVPPRDFLHRTLPHFSRSEIGMVQARWAHINQDYSALTKIQSIMLDGHFVLEHGARYRGGRFFNFNGMAGVWRREAIEGSGGWQLDTVTEDLDLSYRAQMRGWKFVFLEELAAPAELPVAMNAFKAQQHRWALGSVQTCRKLLPRILRSKLPLRVKLEAAFHLTANFNHPLIALLCLLLFPAMYVRSKLQWHELNALDAFILLFSTASIGAFYAISQRQVQRNWAASLLYLPLLLSVGIGLCVNNTRAVLTALSGRNVVFTRTAKYGAESWSDPWTRKKYHHAALVQPLAEIALGLYLGAALLFAVLNGMYGNAIFVALFGTGFFYLGILSIIQQIEVAKSRLVP